MGPQEAFLRRLCWSRDGGSECETWGRGVQAEGTASRGPEVGAVVVCLKNIKGPMSWSKAKKRDNKTTWNWMFDQCRAPRSKTPGNRLWVRRSLYSSLIRMHTLPLYLNTTVKRSWPWGDPWAGRDHSDRELEPCIDWIFNSCWPHLMVSPRRGLCWLAWLFL